MEGAGLSGSIPRRALNPPMEQGYVGRVCDTSQCFLHEPLGPVPVQIVCTCGTAITQPWQWVGAGLEWDVAADYRYTTLPAIDE